MKKRKSLDEQISSFREIENTPLSIDRKLDELIGLLEQSDLDSETIGKLQDKFNKAVDNTKLSASDLKEFRKLDDPGLSRLELADDLENLLSKYKLDSEVSKKYVVAERTSKITLIIIGVLLVALGFAMIIMPAPPYFEMFTIFYFTRDDGVTLMDLIALLIVFTGVYLLVTSLTKFNRQK